MPQGLGRLRKRMEYCQAYFRLWAAKVEKVQGHPEDSASLQALSLKYPNIKQALARIEESAMKPVATWSRAKSKETGLATDEIREIGDEAA
jgi:hypothetical protein